MSPKAAAAMVKYALRDSFRPAALESLWRSCTRSSTVTCGSRAFDLDLAIASAFSGTLGGDDDEGGDRLSCSRTGTFIDVPKHEESEDQRARYASSQEAPSQFNMTEKDSLS